MSSEIVPARSRVRASTRVRFRSATFPTQAEPIPNAIGPGSDTDGNLADDLVRPWIDQADMVRLHAREPAARATHEGGEQGDDHNRQEYRGSDDDRPAPRAPGLHARAWKPVGKPLNEQLVERLRGIEVLQRERAEPPGREALVGEQRVGGA